MTLELELIANGYPAAEVRAWCAAKLNWLAGLLHRQKCNDALLHSLATHDPKKLMALRDETETLEITDDWEPPSINRVKRNMERHGAKG